MGLQLGAGRVMKRGRAAGSREEAGAGDVVFIVVVAAWWAPPSFLEIFAFLSFCSCRDRTEPRSGSPQQICLVRGCNRHLDRGPHKRAKRAHETLNLSTCCRPRAELRRLGGPKLDAYYSPPTSPHHPPLYNTTTHPNSPQRIEETASKRTTPAPTPRPASRHDGRLVWIHQPD
jgi:hypothetical protein